jgi:hypothetical protein
MLHNHEYDNNMLKIRERQDQSRIKTAHNDIPEPANEIHAIMKNKPAQKPT